MTIYVQYMCFVCTYTIVLFSLRACVEGRERHVQHTYHNGDLYSVRGELHSLIYSAQLH